MHWVAPLHTADPGAYALVGMGTLFAGIIRAPMTSVFMIFEITQDYQILVPLMVANLLSFMISRHFQPTRLYHALLEQDHIHVPSPAIHRDQARWSAADVMSAELTCLAGDVSVQHAWDASRGGGQPAFLVGTPEHLLGVVSAERLASALESGGRAEPLSTLVEVRVIHGHPDHPSDVVLERLAQSGGVLPIVSRENAHRLLGVVTLPDVMRFMNKRREVSGPPAFE